MSRGSHQLLQAASGHFINPILGVTHCYRWSQGSATPFAEFELLRKSADGDSKLAELLESIASGAIGFIEMPRGDRGRAAELFEQLVVHYVTNPLDASLLRDLADDARR